MSKASRMGFDGLMERAAALRAMMERCTLCPRACGARRTGGETGFCGCTDALEIASSCIHTGEEPVLGGRVGVGNLFLAHCNMRCAFCQNHQISQTGRRFPVSVDDAARTMLGLRSAGCPTVGFVSPVQHLPMIVEAVARAVRGGFDIPLIYNSNGYDSVEALRLLDGVFDIYLPDFKYAGEDEAVEFSEAPGYPAAALAALGEMFRQAGPLESDSRGIAARGVLVRHLVLPNDLARTSEVLAAIAGVSPQIPVSLMAQYNPVHRAGEHALLSRGLRESEYARAVEEMTRLGLTSGFVQDWRESPAELLPDFDRESPFGGS